MTDKIDDDAQPRWHPVIAWPARNNLGDVINCLPEQLNDTDCAPEVRIRRLELLLKEVVELLRNARI